MPEGISERHQRSCASRDSRRCNCKLTYQAQVYSAREKKRISRTFKRLAEAKSWRHDAVAALNAGTMRAGGSTTLRRVADDWLLAAEAGIVRTRSGHEYKPSAMRGYRRELKNRILPALGAAKLSDIRRGDVQAIVNRLLREGLDPSTVRNAIMPLRAVYRYALSLDLVAANPTLGLQLPTPQGTRERFADPEEAKALIAALPGKDHPIWGTAFYAGLRRGELMALKWEDFDFDRGRISVQRSWDTKAGFITPKSRAGTRTVPIPAVLRKILLEHQLRQGRRTGLAFGRSAELPFSYNGLLDRAARLWKAAKLKPITLHECRHTFASLMIAAGAEPKMLSEMMGHSSVAFTLDRYGHLFERSQQEAADKLDAFIERNVAT